LVLGLKLRVEDTKAAFKSQKTSASGAFDNNRNSRSKKHEKFFVEAFSRLKGTQF
jgi:hypothetical protein